MDVTLHQEGSFIVARKGNGGFGCLFFGISSDGSDFRDIPADVFGDGLNGVFIADQDRPGQAGIGDHASTFHGDRIVSAGDSHGERRQIANALYKIRRNDEGIGTEHD